MQLVFFDTLNPLRIFEATICDEFLTCTCPIKNVHAVRIVGVVGNPSHCTTTSDMEIKDCATTQESSISQQSLHADVASCSIDLFENIPQVRNIIAPVWMQQHNGHLPPTLQHIFTLQSEHPCSTSNPITTPQGPLLSTRALHALHAWPVIVALEGANLGIHCATEIVETRGTADFKDGLIVCAAVIAGSQRLA